MNIPHVFTTCDITFTLGCPLSCKYCPQSIFIKRYNQIFKDNNEKYMSFDTFKKALPKFDKNGCITIGGFSEAFMNHECSKMLSYAATEGYRLCLNTTLVGMNDYDLDLIKDIPFVENVLHIPDKAGNSKFKITDSYLSILKKFTNSDIDIVCYSCHGEPHPAVLPYLDPNKKIISSMSSRAGNVDCEDVAFVSEDIKGKLTCNVSRVDGKNSGLISFKPIILPNGFGALCCSDFGLEHILGDFATQSVEEIVSGSEFRYVLRAMDDDTLPLLCRRCVLARAKGKDQIGDVNLLSGNAMKVGLYIDDYKNERERDLSFLSDHALNILKRIVCAKKICIYGLGNLFHDNFFKSQWNEVFPPDMLSDGNPQLWGKEIEGVQCVSPESLASSVDNKEELLIITWVRNDENQVKKLHSLGLDNVINAYDIFNMFD